MREFSNGGAEEDLCGREEYIVAGSVKDALGADVNNHCLRINLLMMYVV